MKNPELKECVSLPYVETFNSKVIKRFVPELSSRKCFSCCEISMFYVYIYEHYMFFSHIFMYGYVTYSVGL